MSSFQLILDDELLSFYLSIKRGHIDPKDLDDQKLNNFFKLYRSYLTNLKQIQRLSEKKLVEKTQADRLINVLAKQNLTMNLDLEELTHHTMLKIILTTKNEEKFINPCYVNINRTIFDSHYIIAKTADEPRHDLHNFLCHVFSKAKSITIFDKHISNKKEFCQFLDLFPKENLTIFMDLEKDICRTIKTKYPNFIIKKDTFFSIRKNHDRYIIVDNKLQIILSSGIEYLFDDSKEITCIFSHYIKS